MQEDDAVVVFTGERPGRGRGYAYDDSRHRAAYEAVAPLVTGRVVVDAGSGDGAGTALLARSAARVIGLEYHRNSVAQATRDHGGTAVEFRLADLAEPWPVADADVVVAFQILEHFEDDAAFVRHALQTVRPGGTVVITTPNRLQSFSENPYHVREYAPDELQRLLAAQTTALELRGVFGNERVAAFDARRRVQVERWLRLDPWHVRDRLPRPIVEAAFAGLSTLVRRRASGGAAAAGSPITVDDFEVRDGPLEHCLDLFAMARRPSSGPTRS